MDVSAVLFDIGRRVAELRAARGLTQEQLAEQAGLDPTYLQRIEGGRLNLTVRTLVAVATALECAPGDFFIAPQSREVKTGRPRKPHDP